MNKIRLKQKIEVSPYWSLHMGDAWPTIKAVPDGTDAQSQRLITFSYYSLFILKETKENQEGQQDNFVSLRKKS